MKEPEQDLEAIKEMCLCRLCIARLIVARASSNDNALLPDRKIAVTKQEEQSGGKHSTCES